VRGLSWPRVPAKRVASAVGEGSVAVQLLHGLFAADAGSGAAASADQRRSARQRPAGEGDDHPGGRGAQQGEHDAAAQAEQERGGGAQDGVLPGLG
jgi:hypothetical protein